MTLALFDTRYDRHAESFTAFCDDNPEVWRLFVRFSLQAIEAGHKHYSADAVLHRIRWHTSVETRGEDYKINNNFASFYARLFHRFHPQHDGFFRTREQISRRKMA